MDVNEKTAMKNKNFSGFFLLRNEVTFLQTQFEKLRLRRRPTFVKPVIKNLSHPSKTAFDPNAYTNFYFVSISY